MDNWTHAMRRTALTGSFTACLPTPTGETGGLLLFVTMCLGLNTHCGGGRGDGGNATSQENNSLPLRRCVCEQHIEFLLLCDKHTRCRGDLYARGTIENCLLRDAALMSSLHVSQKPLGAEGQDENWRFALCRGHDQACSAVQSPSVRLIHMLVCAAGSRDGR